MPRTPKLTPTRAGIYCRISDAREDDSTGVDRQEKACRKLARERGIEVADVYTDNAVSAYSGRRRPAFERLLADLGGGRIDAVVVWSADRLYRRLADLETLAIGLGSAPVLTVKSGDIDLSTADSRFTARLFGAVALRESEKVGERVSAAAADRAQRGGFSGGKRRFGYTATAPLELIPAEANAIADAYLAVLAGSSLKSIARDWQGRGLVGPTGADFRDVTVRDVLLRAMNAGIATHHGHEVGHSEAPAIVDEDTFRAVRAVLTDPARRRGAGRPAKSLLAPVLRCSVCDGPMNAGTRSRRVGEPRQSIYMCRVGHVSTGRAELDDMVGRLVVRYLERKAGELSNPNRSRTGRAVVGDVAELRARLTRLSDLFAAGDLDADDFAAASRKARERLAQLEAAASVTPSATLASAALVRAGDVAKGWDALDVDARREVVRELVEVVTLSPAPNRGGPFDPDRVGVSWRTA